VPVTGSKISKKGDTADDSKLNSASLQEGGSTTAIGKVKQQ